MIDTRKDPTEKPDATNVDLIRARQKSRAVVMALLLAGFVVLIFAITIAKMSHHG